MDLSASYYLDIYRKWNTESKELEDYIILNYLFGGRWFCDYVGLKDVFVS